MAREQTRKLGRSQADRLDNDRDNIDELVQLEQLCLEQAEQCMRREGKTALLSLAEACHAAAEQARH